LLIRRATFAKETGKRELLGFDFVIMSSKEANAELCKE
jgi:hypothetical protein